MNESDLEKISRGSSSRREKTRKREPREIKEREGKRERETKGIVLYLLFETNEKKQKTI